jgi:hypothetical protein
MTLSQQQPEDDGFERVPGLLAYLPPAWVAVTVLMSRRGLVAGWQAMFDHELPADVRGFVQAGMAASVVTILWGLWVLALAWSRSSRFAFHFTLWQVALIVWILAIQVYVLASGYFLSTVESLAYPAVEIAVGVLCIWVVRRDSGQPLPPPLTPGAAGGPAAHAAALPRSPVVAIASGLLGLVLGGFVGAVGGFVGGGLIAEVTDMSCFEGACGYFAAMVGVVGLLIGAIVGSILAFRWARRGPRTAL